MYCTENCAKYAVSLVYVVCFILTASTPFEWKSVSKVSTQLNTAGNITIKVNSGVLDAVRWKKLYLYTFETKNYCYFKPMDDKIYYEIVAGVCFESYRTW